VDGLLIALVLLTVAIFIAEVGRPLPQWAYDLELAATGVFVVEYLARFWLASSVREAILEEYESSEFSGRPFSSRRALARVAREKWQFMIHPMSIIDLLAIVPSYRPLRLLRFFLLFRLLKLFRYVSTVNTFARVLVEKRFELAVLLAFNLFVITSGAVAIFIFEYGAPGSEFHSLWDAYYWAIVTVSTVGYGDVTPHTDAGRVIAIGLILSGIGSISFLTSILVSGFGQKLDDLMTQRGIQHIRKGDEWIVVMGYGRTAQAMVRDLSARARRRLVVCDGNPGALQRARAEGFVALALDFREASALRSALFGIRARAILVLTDDDVTNTFVVLNLRQWFAQVPIFARLNDSENRGKLLRAGATRVVSLVDAAAEIIAEFSGQPVAFQAVSDLLSEASEYELDLIPVHEGSRLDGLELADLSHGSCRIQLVGLVPPGQGQLTAFAEPSPQASASLQLLVGQPHRCVAGEQLLVLGRREEIRRFKEEYAL
jgi:voltage-gated potassium channel